MAVSVRMNPLLEKELEQAARRRGITKSQFIVEAVERALGQKNPGEIYNQVMQEMAEYHVDNTVEPQDLAPLKQSVKASLRAKHKQDQADYAAFLQQKNAATGGVA